MTNPIPAAVRLWLYLLAAVVLTVAVGGVVPEQYFELVMTIAAVLMVLSAANVNMPGKSDGIATAELVSTADVDENLPDGSEPTEGDSEAL